MSLAPGSRIGHYEVSASIGAGGMGEVYRARDTRLNRDVALKVLPDLFAGDPDRLSRFTREAQTLAVLNHPNIAQIHGLEESGGVRALAMELVPGQTLDELIRRQAPSGVPIDRALQIARQIAEALEAAHDAGIVHRDLKPANIKVRDDGVVKVLDFGLAKATGPDLPGESGGRVLDDSATILSPAVTGMGVILGTAAYMSPEQARGTMVDRRADIWSFGSVLFEMLSGRRAFAGDTVSDLVASVLRQEIDWSMLPAGTPDSIRRLLARCLDRDVKKRLQAIGEARLVLADAIDGLATGESSPPVATGAGAPAVTQPAAATRRASRRAVVGLVAASAVVAAALGLFALSRARGAATVRTPTNAARSIAVLPFVNASGSADDEYIADGITDELIAGLGKVPGLHVAARSSVFALKGQKVEVREIARRLGVETVLEGTVRRSGKRLRVTASLVGAADGLQIWSSTFQNDGGDTFSVQDEVTRGVVSGLALQLGGTALAASRAGRTSDPDAHDLYLRGLSSANPSSEADLRRALQYYQQAIAKDPNFALAYVGIGYVYAFLADAYMPPNEANLKAKAAAQAALDRDSLVADAHGLLGYALSSYDWNAAAADKAFRRALEIDPNSVSSLVFIGFDRCLAGRTREGLEALDRAVRLDPLSPVPLNTREVCLYVGHRFDDVIVANRKTREIDPKYLYVQSWVGAARLELGDHQGAVKDFGESELHSGGEPQYGLAITYARMGRQREARELLRRLDERAKARYVPYWSRAAVRGSLGDMDEAVALLQQAFDTRETWMTAARHLPEVAALAKDPRAERIFKAIDAIQQSAGAAAR